MSGSIFNQKSRVGQVIFEIRDKELLLSSRIFQGPFSEHRFAIDRLNPSYEPRITRNYALVIVPLVVAFGCGAAIWGLMHQTIAPQEDYAGLYLYPVLGLITMLFAAVRGSRRIEYYQFNTLAGQPAFSIIREREQAEECAAFIEALVAQIVTTQSGVLPPKSKSLTLRADLDAGRRTDLSPRRDLWQMSIASGMGAAGFPWIPNIHHYFPDLVFTIVFWLCVAGASLCAFSFVRNEPRRWWSVIGLTLSLVPPFFYG